MSSHKEEIHRLSEAVAVLQAENLSLLAENRSLNAKVEALVARLEGG
ncbi:cell division protein FtsB [Paenibacillus sp. RC73]